ncbi:MAG: DUF1254 domain-containing protein [Desulfomonilaceae bacterium]
MWNAPAVASPQDTTIVTINADTPYSMAQLDLRSEPMVLCVPEIEKGRYCSIQLVDMYTFNYGYIGSRTTGNGAGCYMVAGPEWKGAVPPGIAKVFRSETDFSLAIYRTQLFNPDDIDNVRKIQAAYKVLPLSKFFKKPSPPAPPLPDFPKFQERNAFRTGFVGYLNFLLQFCPAVPEEKELRDRFKEIGIEPGKPYNYSNLPLEDRLGIGMGARDGYAEIKQTCLTLGKEVNGWRVAAAFGDRSFYHGDWLLRAAAGLAGLYGNDMAEAFYPFALTDSKGIELDASKNRYTLTFPKGQYPPVNAFWSVTIYHKKTQLLVDNPIKRYLINSALLPGLEKNPDGSLTIYVQKDSPGKEKESNWLPAPNRSFYLVMRLYWPKKEALKETWKPAPVIRVD